MRSDITTAADKQITPNRVLSLPFCLSSLTVVPMLISHSDALVSRNRMLIQKMLATYNPLLKKNDLLLFPVYKRLTYLEKMS
jgi:hypothetical protein